MNIFRTIVIPISVLPQVDAIAQAFGQVGMFTRSCGVNGQDTHRIASGVLDDVFDGLLNPDENTVALLLSKGINITLDTANTLAAAVVATELSAEQTLATLGLTLNG